MPVSYLEGKKTKSKRLQFSPYIIAHIVELFLFLCMNPHKPYYTLTKILQVNPGENWKKSCIFCVVPIMSTTRDFFLWFNSTIAFAIGVLGISRAFLVKLLRLCTIYHSLTCVMFQILVQRGYSWRQLFLCWAVIKDNISYLSKQKEKGKSTAGTETRKMSCFQMLYTKHTQVFNLIH